MSKHVYVNCYNRLVQYNNINEAKSFFSECYYSSEGSERERYSNIIMDMTYKNDICFSDGDKNILFSDINFKQLNKDDLGCIKEFYNINDLDVLKLMAKNQLSKIGKQIYNLNNYESFEDYYEKDKNKHFKYFMFSDDNKKIICFDIYNESIKSADSYFCEEFDLEDYDFACKWLDNQIEMDEYYSYKRANDKEI